MRKIKSFEIIEIRTYSSTVIFDFIKTKNIEIFDFQTTAEDLFRLRIRKKNHRDFFKFFKEIRIIKKEGLGYVFSNLLIKKVTLISLIIGTIFFSYLKLLIFDVNINGNSLVLDQMILNRVEELGIKKYAFLPSFEELVEIKEQLEEEYIDNIEMIEIVRKGSVIKITYIKRRTPIEIETRNTKMYAKKDGIIERFEISSGDIKVFPNQYVKKGDLLVDDVILVNDKEIHVGTSGAVYAYTFSLVEIELKLDDDYEESEVLAYLLLEGKRKMSANFSNGECIDKENVLSFTITKRVARIKIHYTCIENIVTYTPLE